MSVAKRLVREPMLAVLTASAATPPSAWFFDCPATQPSDVTLFVRKPPYDCFIKQRRLMVSTKLRRDYAICSFSTSSSQPFQEVHVSINGIVNTTAFAYRPYKNLGPQYCNVTENTLNCVLLNAGEISVVFFFTFVVLLSEYILVLGLVSSIWAKTRLWEFGSTSAKSKVIPTHVLLYFCRTTTSDDKKKLSKKTLPA